MLDTSSLIPGKTDIQTKPVTDEMREFNGNKRKKKLLWKDSTVTKHKS